MWYIHILTLSLSGKRKSSVQIIVSKKFHFFLEFWWPKMYNSWLAGLNSWSSWILCRSSSKMLNYVDRLTFFWSSSSLSFYNTSRKIATLLNSASVVSRTKPVSSGFTTVKWLNGTIFLSFHLPNFVVNFLIRDISKTCIFYKKCFDNNNKLFKAKFIWNYREKYQQIQNNTSILQTLQNFLKKEVLHGFSMFSFTIRFQRL